MYPVKPTKMTFWWWGEVKRSQMVILGWVGFSENATVSAKLWRKGTVKHRRAHTLAHTEKKKGQRKSYKRTDGERCLFFLLCAVGIDREGLYGHAGFRGAGGCGAHSGLLNVRKRRSWLWFKTDCEPEWLERMWLKIYLWASRLTAENWGSVCACADLAMCGCWPERD